MGPSKLKIPDGAYSSNTTQHVYPSLPPSLPLSPLISLTLSFYLSLSLCAVPSSGAPSFSSRDLIIIKMRRRDGCLSTSPFPSFSLLLSLSLSVSVAARPAPGVHSPPPITTTTTLPSMVTLEGWHHRASPISFFLPFHISCLSLAATDKRCTINVCKKN